MKLESGQDESEVEPRVWDHAVKLVQQRDYSVARAYRDLEQAE